jgi:hypothetical protein
MAVASLPKSNYDEASYESPPQSGRASIKAAALLLLLTVIFYWKIILVHQYSMLMGYEGVNQAYAWFNFWVSTIRQGIWPLWDPFTFSGHAFAGEMQTGAFYPLYALFLAVPFNHGVFSPQLYHVFYVLTHALSAWFMYLLARELRLSFFAGLVAGTCFSLGGVLVRFNGWPHLLESGIWLPLIVLLLLRALRASRTKDAISYSSLAGLALAMAVLAGGMHIIIMEGIVVLSACVFHAASSRQGRDRTRAAWIRGALTAAVCGAFALAGGAVQLLPSIEYSRQALRFLGPIALPATEKIPYNYMGDALWPHSFLAFLFPAFAGSASSGEYMNPYIGVLPLLLAILGVWKCWGYLWVRYLAGLAFAACLYSLGSFSLLHGLLYAITPALWMAREANRFMYLADFGIAILAGFGLDVLFARAPSSFWHPINVIIRWVALACVFALAYPFVLGKGDLGAWISLSLLLILLTCALFRYILAGNHGRWARFLVIALILFDLSAFDWGPADKITEAAASHDEMARLLTLRNAAEYLRSRPGPFRVEVGGNNAPNIGDVFGIEETLGAAVTMQKDYSVFRGHGDLLNTQYVLKPASTAEPGAVYADSWWKIYPRPGAYPAAWLVHLTQVEPDPGRLRARLDAPGIDLHRTALLASSLNSPLDSTPGGSNETAIWRKSRQDRVEFTVHADGRALLVMSELFYPGWKATVNGLTVPILKVDGALRGVVVPDGDSGVSLHYAPASFYAGLTLTIAAFAGGGVLGFRLRRQ